MERVQVYKILQKYMQAEHLLKHSVSVEIALRFYAEKFGEDQEYWGAVGLLHDIDFEKYPEKHLQHSREILLAEGFTEEFVEDVNSHGRDWPKERTLLQKVLLACDEMTGFIIACALVRPDKSLETLEVKSVLKKMKDKGFARAVDRKLLQESAEGLGLELQEHIECVRLALAQSVNKDPYQELRLLG